MTKKSITVFFLCMVLCLSGCGRAEEQKKKNDSAEVKIPVVLRANPITGEKENEDLIEAFNKAYRGKYFMDVKWVMETEDVYRQNLKKQNVTGNLPVILTDVRVQPAFYKRMAEDNRMMSIGNLVEEDPEWAKAAGEEFPERYAAPFEEVYLAPGGSDRLSCVGIFYHKDMVRRAGWEEFPKTQEEFTDLLKALKKEGTAALSLHTEGTAWAAMLPATAELALSGEGEKFMKTFLPEKFNTPSGLQLAEILKRNFQYTTKDALYTDFDVAYSNFINGQTAMIANGYWMIQYIPEAKQSEIGFAPFPGNILISSPETFGWAISESAGEKEKEGAVAFLKFRTLWDRRKQEEIFRDGGRSSLERAYIKVAENSPRIIPNYQINWDSCIQEKKIPEYLPLLAGGEMSPKEFVEALDE